MRQEQKEGQFERFQDLFNRASERLNGFEIDDDGIDQTWEDMLDWEKQEQKNMTLDTFVERLKKNQLNTEK